MYKFNNILGNFILDDKLNIVKKKGKTEDLPEDKIPQVLALFKDKKYYNDFYKKNLELTKQSLKDSVSEDQLIIQAIANIGELDKICNILTKRLREWFSWYYPELSEEVTDNHKFAELVLSEKKKDSMGADISKVHQDEMKLLAKEILAMFALRDKHEDYLKKVMEKYCPNLLELAGTTIGAGLIELGKSLKHLALLPASTIQVLGAEKALFRHIKTGSKPPKYGILHSHPLVQRAKRNYKGKAARMLADKLSLCARLDFFKGEFKAPGFKKELKEKLDQ